MTGSGLNSAGEVWKKKGGRIFAILSAVFIVVPMIDVVVLVSIGRHIGFWQTITIVIVSGLAGGWLMKTQGLAVWRQMQRQWGEGEMPADAMMDAVIILIAGGMLTAPGFITDILGLILMLPPVRAPIRRYMKRKFENWMTTQFEMDLVEL